MFKFINKEYIVLDSPIPNDEIEKMECGDIVEGVVAVWIADLVQLEFEDCIDFLSDKLIDNEYDLHWIDYKTVGVADNGKILVHVSGEIQK